MDGRGRKLGRRQDSKESRDSSVSSTSREVRCGCQYFQSDSLLPERHTLVGTRPSSRNMGDHEYEPISPPPPASQPASPPLLKVTDQEGQEKMSDPEPEQEPEPEPQSPRTDFAPTIDRSKYEYLRIPLDQDLIIPIDKAEIESLRYDDEEEGEHNANEMTAQDIQDQIEARFFTATPTTTISRTDGEFNTSQMDSSGLDELPLKKDARKGFNAKGFQQRIQSQAGRLRTRIRNIPRPKINLPERPKFNLPERPKFERPKFNFPERPKFNIKRPDIKMPNFNFGKTKTSSIRRPLRDRTQIPSNQSTVGSKKNIFDSINFSTYPRIFSKKKKTAQGRRALTPPPRMETESSPPSSPASRTGPVSQRWTHRFKDIKFADDDDNSSDLKKPSFDDDVEDDTAPFRDPDFKAAVTLNDKKQMKSESSVSIPGSDKEQQSSGSSSERHRAGVIEEIDSDEFFLREKGLSREDVDVSRYLSLEIRDAFRSPKNALARIDGDLYDDDDDNEGYEYEPKQHPLGEPIRLSMEALRNQSLEQIRMTPERDRQYTRDDEEFQEPVKPERTRSLKKRSSRSQSEELKSDAENQFTTYPPNRPTRPRKQSSQSKHSITTDNYGQPEKEIEAEIVSISKRQPSVPSLAITYSTHEVPPTRYIDESSEALNEPWMDERQPPLPPKRRKSTRDSSLDNESLSAHAHNYNKEIWLDDERHGNIILDDDDVQQRRLNQNRFVQNGYYDTPPQAPIRKSRSQGTSLADEDRTSRGADSLISETRTHLTEDEPVDTKSEVNSFKPDHFNYATVEKTVIENKPIVVDKPARPPPPSRKSKTAAQLTALKNQSINFFFTYPRRAIKKSLQKQPETPERPTRNYSSIGPARPPRRNRVFREPVYEGEFIPLKDENDISTQQDESKKEYIDSEVVESTLQETTINDDKTIEKSDHESQEVRDLQSGDVIEKMKGRPLPPPPRPPRKTKDDFADTDDYQEEGEVEVTDLDDDGDVVVERIDILVAHPQHENAEHSKSTNDVQKQQEEFDQQIETDIDISYVQPVDEPPLKVERRKKSLSVPKTVLSPALPTEASISTQTDSLPEGFYVEEEPQQKQSFSKSDDTPTKIVYPAKEQKEEVEKKVETIVEHKVVVIPTPETEILKTKKLHVEELDVEKLNVTELQAKKITVSDIDGVSMQVTELSSKSGHLVISGFDLPSSFLEAITPPPPPAPVIQIQSSTQTPPQTTDSQTNTILQEQVPLQQIVGCDSEITQQQTVSQHPIPPPPLPQRRPSPPPSIVIQSPQGQSSPAYVPGYIPTSPPPRPPLRTRSHGHESEEELRILPRRRRHHSQKHSTQYSSDDDEEEYPSYPIVRRSHQHELTSSDLIRQLLTIWQSSLMRGVNRVVEGVNVAFPEGEKRKDAQTAACMILVLLAGLMVIGLGSDRTVHHHHWDFLPPHP